jgi:hypothetical protein
LRREPVDLAATAAEVLRAHDHPGLITTTALEPARTTGDPRLIERLVANLVANAIRHNIPGGRLDIATRPAARRATFTIANTGPVIPADELARLFQPFHQLSNHPGPSDDGFGLGLAIVRAIANAHDATVTAQAPTGGGLRIDIDFPSETPRRLEVVHGGTAAATAVGQFRAAQRACRGLLPALQNSGPSPAQQQAREQDLLAFARCVRSHGQTNFPDPTSHGQLTVAMIHAAGVDLHAPNVLPTARACIGVAHGLITPNDVARAINGQG